MKIKQIIERECCEPRDLIMLISNDSVGLCRYCNKKWKYVIAVDPSEPDGKTSYWQEDKQNASL